MELDSLEEEGERRSGEPVEGSAGHGGRRKDGGRRWLARLGFGSPGKLTETEPGRKEKDWGVLRGCETDGDATPSLSARGEASRARQQGCCLPACFPSMADWQRRRSNGPLEFLKNCKEVPAARKAEKEQGFGDLFGRFSFCKKDIWKAHEKFYLTIFFFYRIEQGL